MLPTPFQGGLGGQNHSPNNTKTLFAFFTVLTSCSEAKAMVREITSPLVKAPVLTVIILFAATESQLKKKTKKPFHVRMFLE